MRMEGIDVRTIQTTAMKNLKKPATTGLLFDLEASAWWSTQLSPGALRRLREGWQGIFQRTILGLLERPAQALGAGLDEELGRPSKELYAMSGLLLIAEFQDWTIDEAAEAWTLNAGVQFALHLPRDRQYLSARTLDHYRRLLREKVEVQEVFTTVTAALVAELELDIRKQRLDSTHVLSAMAQLGRAQLLSVAVRRFLVQLKKHDAAGYAELEPGLRERYEAAESRLFGQGTRKPQAREEVLAQVAADLAWLVERFGKDPAHEARASYQALERLLREHCEVRADKTVVVHPQSRDEKGGSARCLQNPSDTGAGYSGHKGPGYQVQLAQALPPRDAEGKIEGPGLVTACVPQSAAVRDNEALGEVLAQQQRAGLLPEQTTADTIYGSDANVQACAALGVRLVSPVGGLAPRAAQPSHHCSAAERALKARLAERREQQETEAWKREYAQRSGIEGLNRALDVATGCKELRARGTRAVEVAVSLKVTGWNILAAAKIRGYRARRAARQTRPGGPGQAGSRAGAFGSRFHRPRRTPMRTARRKLCRRPEKNPALEIAPPPKNRFCACI
jgi:hypothetical protein